MGLSVSLHKCRVAVDVLAEAFADDQVGLRNLDVLGDLRAFGVLHAMVRPQHLVTIANLDRLERLLVWIAGRERHVVWRMPVLRHHHIVETFGDAVDYRNNLIAIFQRARITAGAVLPHIMEHPHADGSTVERADVKMDKTIVLRPEAKWVLILQHTIRPNNMLG
jgi:hypothetical protein